MDECMFFSGLVVHKLWEQRGGAGCGEGGDLKVGFEWSLVRRKSYSRRQKIYLQFLELPKEINSVIFFVTLSPQSKSPVMNSEL